MPIKYNGTTLSGVTYNNTKLTKVIYDGVVVFELSSSLKVYQNGVCNGCTGISGYLGYPVLQGYHRPSTTNSNNWRVSGTTSRSLWAANAKGSLLTNAKIDLTKWKYITIKGNISGSYDNYGAWVTQNNTGVTYQDVYTNVVTSGYTSLPLNTKTNISALMGGYYLGVYLSCGSSNAATITITEIVLET